MALWAPWTAGSRWEYVEASVLLSPEEVGLRGLSPSSWDTVGQGAQSTNLRPDRTGFKLQLCLLLTL